VKKRTNPQDAAIAAAVARAIAPLAAEIRALRETRAQPAKIGSVAEAALATGLCEATIRRQIKAGQIAAKRVGRRLLVDMAALTSSDKRRA
jgi:excisionase family DNA binding protein